MAAMTNRSPIAAGSMCRILLLPLLGVAAGCANPVILDPTITIVERSVARACDGEFTVNLAVRAVYPPPPPVPFVRGETIVSRPRAALAATNLAGLSFSGLPETFTQDGTEILTVTGRLANACQTGTLNVDVDLAFQGGRSGGAVSGPVTIDAVPLIVAGPTADPQANPNGAFAYGATLTCCVPPSPAGAYPVTLVRPINVVGQAVAPPVVNCIAGPNPTLAAAVTGRLDPPNAIGGLSLQATGPAGAPAACVLRTIIRPAPN